MPNCACNFLFHCFPLQVPHWLEWQRIRFPWTNQEWLYSGYFIASLCRTLIGWNERMRFVWTNQEWLYSGCIFASLCRTLSGWNDRGWDFSGRIRSVFIQAVSLLPFAGPSLAGMTEDEIPLDESGATIFKFVQSLIQTPSLSQRNERLKRIWEPTYTWVAKTSFTVLPDQWINNWFV